MAACFLTAPMAALLVVIVVVVIVALLSSTAGAAPSEILPRRASLVVEEHETSVLRSPGGAFTCGFFPIPRYDGAFTFSIWYTGGGGGDRSRTVVWSANRGRPVHARRAAVTLRRDGNLALTDFDGAVVWQTDVAAGAGAPARHARLLDAGNLVLENSTGAVLWQSFDSPTDTFLPTQRITAASTLAAAGRYALRFSDQSILSLLYDDGNVSDVYWPDPDYQYYENNRRLYNSSRTAILHDSGDFLASDFAGNHTPAAADRAAAGVMRRLTLDHDGNLRLYSLDNDPESKTRPWTVSWIAVAQPCLIHGLCGPYGVCHYSPAPTCSCPPGYTMNNPRNWTQGCSSIGDISCDVDPHDVTFLELRNTDFWGSDQSRTDKVSLEYCWELCKKDCTCKGFQYQAGNGTCYPKALLFNGRSFPTPTVRAMYIKVPKSLDVSKMATSQSNVLDPTPRRLGCDDDQSNNVTLELFPDVHKTGGEGGSTWYYFYGFIVAFFMIEVFFFAFAWFFVLRKEKRSSRIWAVEEGYKAMTSHFRMYSYKELVKATEKFKHELGGFAYKGILDDDRVVVVKNLENVRQNKEEFQDELHVIARINHMNLVRICGFCSERSHRMLVFEYVENGSLANILFKNKILLEWKQRFNIALGVAKGLAYLHHECLEWVIHCNLKPENILLDQNLEPKITDFGLAKLVSRSGPNRNESRARGTIGYIAPEWVSGLPITAKVDVYSYGVVLLELVSGTRVFDFVVGEDDKVHVMLNKFVKMLAYRLDRDEPLWLADLVDFRLGGEFDYSQAKALIRLVVSCLEEDRKRRPTMESVVESLLSVDEAGS